MIDQRKLVIEASEAERLEQGDDDEVNIYDEVAAALDLQNPSAKTMAKIQDYGAFPSRFLRSFNT